VDVCWGGCGGIWFDNFELQRVDEETEFAGQQLVNIPTDAGVEVDYERRRGCPKCPDVVMMRHFFSERKQVQVDKCPSCGGVWLDAGELELIRAESAVVQDREAAAKEYFDRLFRQDFFRSRGRTGAQP
jgi:Zn-finger nucleic acid-binding protein